VIDGIFVNGSARVVGWLATVVRRIQSGFLYDYAFAMIIGVLLLLSAWILLPVLIGQAS
jgi:NADH-quinone oxidoreductase subunit L